MPPCSMLLSRRYGGFLATRVAVERYRDEYASDPREVLLIDNTFYPINTPLAVGQATHSLWQWFDSTWDDTSGEMHGYLVAFHWRR
jgi:hypothetical protein